MPNARFTRLETAKKEAILEAAMEEFATYDYELASINRIIEKADLTKGSLYYYFDNKEDIYITAINEDINRWWEFLGNPLRIFANKDFWQAVTTFIELRLEYVYKFPHSLGLMRGMLTIIDKEQGSAILNKIVNKNAKRFNTFLKIGYQKREIRTDLPFDLLSSLFFAVFFAMLKWKINKTPDLKIVEAKEFSEKMINVFKRVFKPEDPQSHTIKLNNSLKKEKQ